MPPPPERKWKESTKRLFVAYVFLQDKKHDCLAKIAQIYSSPLLTGDNYMDEWLVMRTLFCSFSCSCCYTLKAEPSRLSCNFEVSALCAFKATSAQTSFTGKQFLVPRDHLDLYGLENFSH